MPDLLHFILINASPSEVYRAIATQQGMQGWWTRDTVIEPKHGSKAEFGFVKRAVVFRMIIDALDPDKLVRIICSGEQPEWEGTTLEWKIVAAADGSALHFSHRD